MRSIALCVSLCGGPGFQDKRRATLLARQIRGGHIIFSEMQAAATQVMERFAVDADGFPDAPGWGTFSGAHIPELACLVLASASISAVLSMVAWPGRTTTFPSSPTITRPQSF